MALGFFFLSAFAGSILNPTDPSTAPSPIPTDNGALSPTTPTDDVLPSYTPTDYTDDLPSPTPTDYEENTPSPTSTDCNDEPCDFCQIGSDIDGEAEGDFLGRSVSMTSSGNRIVVGADRNNGNGNEDSGHARVYEYQHDDWIQVGSDIDGESAGDYFGFSVAISDDGNRVVVGAPTISYKNGYVRVLEYQHDDDSWAQVGSDLDGNTDSFGWSVAISSDGSRIVATSRLGHGQAQVYEYQDEEWVQVGSSLEGEAPYDQFGYSVDMSSDGNRVIVGAPNNDGNGNSAGHARAYEQHQDIDDVWVQIGSDIDGEAADNYFGYSVAISDDGNRIVVGAPLNDNDNRDSAGRARVYEYQENNGGWVQIGSDIDGENMFDSFAVSVAMSGSGNKIVVGASSNGDSGHARVFQYKDGEWLQVGLDIDGEAPGDLSGRSVSMSGDGNQIAVGAAHNDGDNGSNSGHVRVFSLSGSPC